MLPTTFALALFGGLCSVVRSSPVARDNDGARPISWQDPSGQYFCWAVQGQLTAGATIGVATCDDSQAQSFIYNDGSTSIKVSGTNLCVEFGPGLGRNGTPLRVQNCRSNGAPGQRLFVTEDYHVALQNGPGQCADVRDAEGPLQSWRCASDNANQIFTFGPPPSPLPVGLGRLRSVAFSNACLNANPSQGANVFIDTACEPLAPYTAIVNFTTGSIPVLQDAAGKSFYLAVGIQDDVYFRVTLSASQQDVRLEAGTDDGTFRVVLTTSDNAGGQLCLVKRQYGGLGFGFWESCNPSNGAEYFFFEPTENRLSK